ncbi:MAG: ribosome-binding factor A [Patescibacteria group bacterium]|nr:ribosome-binding factor A [Patescibacteria group bacterium]
MSNRIRKINEQIRELVSASISKHISRELLPTVKAVETSRDLKHARVWVSSLGDEEKLMTEIKEHKREIQHEVTSQLFTKYTPILEFSIDHSGEYVEKIEKLLNES